MYTNSEITGNREEFIKQQAAEWIALNSEYDSISDIRFINNKFCFIEYGVHGVDTYSHSWNANRSITKILYLVLAVQIMINKGIVTPAKVYLIDAKNITK